MRLRPSQRLAVEAVTPASILLLADMGSGKTAVALTAIRRRRVIHGKRRTLLISTVRICKYVWPEEAGKWTPELNYSPVASQTPEARRRVIEAPYIDIVGINFENLPWLAANYTREQLSALFDNLVIDESSRLENPGGAQFKALAAILPAFDWCLPMTGTPRANRLEDLWAHAYLVDQGRTLGKYREGFRKKYFKEIYLSPQHSTFKPNKGAEAEIYAKLKTISHRLVFDGDSPEVCEIDIKVAMPSMPKAPSRMKQVQIDSGAVYTPDGTTDILHTKKIEALVDLIGAATEPVLIVYNFIHEQQRLLTAFPSAKLIESAADVAAWNAGDIPLLLIHPLSAGHGLNVQHGGSVMVWFSPPPTEDAELYEQCVARLARSGQRSPVVRVYRLMSGADAIVYKAIKAKLEEQKALKE